MEQLGRGQMGGSPEARDGRDFVAETQRDLRLRQWGLWREPGGRSVSVV